MPQSRVTDCGVGRLFLSVPCLGFHIFSGGYGLPGLRPGGFDYGICLRLLTM